MKNTSEILKTQLSEGENKVKTNTCMEENQKYAMEQTKSMIFPRAIEAQGQDNNRRTIKCNRAPLHSPS